MSTRSGKTYNEPKRSKKKTSVKDTTFDSTTPDKAGADNMDTSTMSTRDLRSRRSSIKDSTFDKSNSSMTKNDIDSATDSNWIISDVSNKLKRRKSNINTHSNGSLTSVTNGHIKKESEVDSDGNIPSKRLRKRKISVANNTFDKNDKINTTYEKETGNMFEKDEPAAVFVNNKKKGKNKTLIMSEYNIEKDTESDKAFEKNESLTVLGNNKKKGKSKTLATSEINIEKDTEKDKIFVKDETATAFVDKKKKHKNKTPVMIEINIEKDKETEDETATVSGKNKKKSKNKTFLMRENNIENEKDIETDEITTAVIKKKGNSKTLVISEIDIEKDTENDLNSPNVAGQQIKRKKKKVKGGMKKKGKKSKDVGDTALDKADNILNTTFDKEKETKDISIEKDTSESNENNVQKDLVLNTSTASKKNLRSNKSYTKDTTFEKEDIIDTTFEKTESSNKTFDSKDNNYIDSSKVNVTFDKNNKNNDTFEKDASTSFNTFKKGANTRKSSIHEVFNTSNHSSPKVDEQNQNTLTKSVIKTRKSLTRQTTEIYNSPQKHDSTFDKTSNIETSQIAPPKVDVQNQNTLTNSAIKTRKSLTRQTTEIYNSPKKHNSTFDKTSNIETTQNIPTKEDVQNQNTLTNSATKTRKSLTRQTTEIYNSPKKLDSTFDKTSNIETTQNIPPKVYVQNQNTITNSAIKTRKSLTRQTTEIYNSPKKHNSTFDKTSNIETSQNIPDDTSKLNTTFDKEVSKSSLISSDNSISRISITSDESAENIMNTTPVLVESSLDISQVKESPKEAPKTPLKREGTFTKDSSDIQVQSPRTPGRSQPSLTPAAGCTPYHIGRSSQKKPMLNITRSIEKRLAVEAPRLTRVMFCSPVDNPVLAGQDKRKIIKSNLKGSNKSFVFDESASVSRPGRKRSYTHSDADDGRAKRSRLAEDLQHSVDRLSRPRTATSTVKPAETTPKKPTIPFKSKSETKPARTRLPNFAALHQRQFDKMESLGECQERKAKRAKQMLTPTGSKNMLERISPTNAIDVQKQVTKEQPKPKDKTDTPTKKLPTLESLRPGFTRFGFKLNLDPTINPFSVPSKNEKPKAKPNGFLQKAAILPSVAGATSVRREVAKQTVMREKSLLSKRKLNRSENRTIIKGVRTNRRFDLQMKLRNLE